ncbi:hypothetical protein GF325_10605 [Candidatus Bathyarchaeota archaeon]|nr:hypothetical protein [Candidatus Bathyarchaeota archaeon]
MVESLLLKLVAKGSIRGHFDPGTNEFISGMIPQSRITGVVAGASICPHCGSALDTIPVKGTTVKCHSCGNLLMVK